MSFVLFSASSLVSHVATVGLFDVRCTQHYNAVFAIKWLLFACLVPHKSHLDWCSAEWIYAAAAIFQRECAHLRGFIFCFLSCQAENASAVQRITSQHMKLCNINASNEGRALTFIQECVHHFSRSLNADELIFKKKNRLEEKNGRSLRSLFETKMRNGLFISLLLELENDTVSVQVCGS